LKKKYYINPFRKQHYRSHFGSRAISNCYQQLIPATATCNCYQQLLPATAMVSRVPAIALPLPLVFPRNERDTTEDQDAYGATEDDADRILYREYIRAEIQKNKRLAEEKQANDLKKDRAEYFAARLSEISSDTTSTAPRIVRKVCSSNTDFFHMKMGSKPMVFRFFTNGEITMVLDMMTDDFTDSGIKIISVNDKSVYNKIKQLVMNGEMFQNTATTMTGTFGNVWNVLNGHEKTDDDPNKNFREVFGPSKRANNFRRQTSDASMTNAVPTVKIGAVPMVNRDSSVLGSGRGQGSARGQGSNWGQGSSRGRSSSRTMTKSSSAGAIHRNRRSIY